MKIHFLSIAFFILIIFHFNTISYAAQSIVLHDSSSEQFVTRQFVDYWEDASRKVDFTQIIQEKSTDFKISTFSDFKNTKITSAYWIRFSVLNQSEKDFLLELFDYDIDEVTFYQVDKNGQFVSKQVGYKFPFVRRDVEHKNIIFHLNVPKNQTQTFYIRFFSRKINILEPVIRSYSRSISYSLTEYLFFGIYYGLLLLMVFHNSLYFILLRKLHYLFYVMQVIGILVYQMSLNGTGFQYLWGDSPELNYYMDNFGSFVCISGMLLFAVTFLELNTRCQLKKNILFFLLGIRAILFLIQILNALIFPWEIIDLILVQVVLAVGLMEYSSGYRPAKWYILAYFILDLAFIITWLEHLGWLKSNLCTVYALNVGIVTQFIFLSISIGESVKETYKQKNEASEKLFIELAKNSELQEKVNRELEQKVKERTNELEERNKEIESQRVEINAINDHLEELIKIRTKELEDKNNRIREYAFSNSHLVRGPLARILGLAIIAKSDPRELAKLMTLIEENANELDQIIREMNRLLSENE